MKRSILYAAAAAVSAAAAFLLTACGFNGIMYRHLSDRSNYYTYAGIVSDIRVLVHEEERGWVWHSWDPSMPLPPDESLYLELTFRDGMETEYYFSALEILPANAALLIESGFFEIAKQGKELLVTASSWIYMDGTFCYMIGASADGVVYLDDDAGLQNVITLMDENRGLL